MSALGRHTYPLVGTEFHLNFECVRVTCMQMAFNSNTALRSTRTDTPAMSQQTTRIIPFAS